MLWNILRFRPTKICSRKAWRVILVIMNIWIGAVQSRSQSKDVEERLRARMTAYWEAMKSGDYQSAAQYVHPDSRNLFTYEIPKSTVLAWKIDKLEFNGDYTVCDTITRVTKPIPFYGAKVDWPLQNRWVLKDGEWYFKIPWEKGQNPLVELFKAQQAADRVSAQRNSSIGGTTPSASVAASSQGLRLEAETSNPTAVHFGEKSIFRFSYRNTGTTPFKIVSVHSDCHCTGVKKNYPEIAPGESGTLEVMVDTFGLPPGRLDKEISVQFSDLSDPILIRLSFENLPNFVISPATVDFGNLEAGRVARQSVRILNQSGKSVKIVSQMNTDPRLELSLDRMSLEPGASIILSLSYKAVSPGEIFDNLFLRTDLEAEPLMNIPVRGKVGVRIP